MPHLRRVRAPEGWSGDTQFRAACKRATVDIDWVSSDNLVVGNLTTPANYFTRSAGRSSAATASRWC